MPKIKILTRSIISPFKIFSLPITKRATPSQKDKRPKLVIKLLCEKITLVKRKIIKINAKAKKRKNQRPFFWRF